MSIFLKDNGFAGVGGRVACVLPKSFKGGAVVGGLVRTRWREELGQPSGGGAEVSVFIQLAEESIDLSLFVGLLFFLETLESLSHSSCIPF